MLEKDNDIGSTLIDIGLIDSRQNFTFGKTRFIFLQLHLHLALAGLTECNNASKP